MQSLIDGYKLHLYSTNTSPPVHSIFNQKKIIENEVIMDIVCQITKAQVSIPIRHFRIIDINCIFDLESWIFHYQEAIISKQQYFDCPGCQAQVKFSDYGVDYSLLNVIAIINEFQLDQHIVKSKIGLALGENLQYRFFAFEKPLEINKKFNIPGTEAILGGKRNIYKQQNAITQTQQIQEDLSFTIFKMKQYLKQNKKYKSFIAQNDNIQQMAIAISQEYLKNTWFNKLGQQSFKNDIVFSIKMVQGGNHFTAYLIIYFIHYKVWIDYELYDDNQYKYIPNEHALYLKDSDQKSHYIYIIGGKTGQLESTNKFQRITIPLNPFEQSRRLQVNNLTPLPRDGFKFIGGIHNGQIQFLLIKKQRKIFVFYGQRRIVGANNYVKEELLNSSLKYENGTWKDLQLKLLPRFDGSSFISSNQNIEKFILFYGGLEKQPEGLAQPYCKQQKKAQIFIFKTENFLGISLQQQQPSFEVNFDYPDKDQQYSLCSPILSVPYQPDVQLLLSGEYLKDGLIGKRLIFNFNYGAGVVKLNKVFSVEPPEYALTPYLIKQFGSETFTPIHDSCGAILHGTYYSIIQNESKSKEMQTNLIKINLTNGQVKLFDYEDSSLSQQRAQEFINTLPNIETQKIILN